MEMILIVATALSIVPCVAALFMPDYYLGDFQNAVEETTLEGDKKVDALPALETREA